MAVVWGLISSIFRGSGETLGFMGAWWGGNLGRCKIVLSGNLLAWGNLGRQCSFPVGFAILSDGRGPSRLLRGLLEGQDFCRGDILLSFGVFIVRFRFSGWACGWGVV